MRTAPIGLLMTLIMCVAVVSGCGTTAAPPTPTPQTVSGMTRDRTSYTFLQWKEGLAVMLVDQCDVHHMSGQSGHGEPVRRIGDAHRWDKNTSEWQVCYEWELETPDGRTAQFSVNNVQYDLEKGSVFRIDSRGTVQQHDRDLTDLQANRRSCDNFVTAIDAVFRRRYLHKSRSDEMR